MILHRGTSGLKLSRKFLACSFTGPQNEANLVMSPPALPPTTPVDKCGGGVLVSPKAG
jgi:hypothetical protein